MRTLFADSRIDIEEEENLLKMGFSIIKCPLSTKLYEAVSGHPDMLLHIISCSEILVHKDIDNSFVKLLQEKNIKTMISKNSLESTYPRDVMLNAVSLDNYFIHNIKCTDENLLKLIKNKKIINVNQGYTKCSTAIVANKAIMTSDKGIAKALYNEGFDVLLLTAGDIDLPGLNYGFIGGCAGLIDKNLMAFYGDLNFYNQGKAVYEFLKKYKVKTVFLRRGRLVDRGSILTLGDN